MKVKQKETARPLLCIVTEQSKSELPEFEEEESLLDIEPLSPLPSNFDTPTSPESPHILSLFHFTTRRQMMGSVVPPAVLVK